MIARRRSWIPYLGSLFVFALTTASAPAIARADGLGADDLDEMLGPIALYPDELLANVLTAAMYPDDIAAAGKYVGGGGDTAKLGEKGWEPSVVAIARIPELIKMMNENLDWTRALGEAYVVQAEDVMASVQRLRAKAKTNGALVSNEQQTVTQDGETIIIQPAQPQVIYVPQYSPQVVYVDSGPSAGDVALGMAMMFGTALMMDAIFDNSMGCYWGGGGYVGWGHPPYYGGGYHNNDIDINIDNEINIDNDRINTDGSRGRDGQRVEPNNKKVDTNALRSGKTKSLDSYKGSANRAKTGAGGGPKIPSGAGPARAQDRAGAGGPGQQANRPSAGTRDAATNRDAAATRDAAANRDAANRPSTAQRDAKPSASNRGDAGNLSGSTHNRPQATPATRDASSRPSAPKASASNSSAFRPSSGDAKASSRGHASRTSSGGGSRSSSGSGGGGRGGGGGGGGHRGR